jgi:hypothetical protein
VNSRIRGLHRARCLQPCTPSHTQQRSIQGTSIVILRVHASLERLTFFRNLPPPPTLPVFFRPWTPSLELSIVQSSMTDVKEVCYNRSQQRLQMFVDRSRLNPLNKIECNICGMRTKYVCHIKMHIKNWHEGPLDLSKKN